MGREDEKEARRRIGREEEKEARRRIEEEKEKRGKKKREEDEREREQYHASPSDSLTLTLHHKRLNYPAVHSPPRSLSVALSLLHKGPSSRHVGPER